jgi:hypothetical protein
MQDAVRRVPRIPLPRTLVNKGPKPRDLGPSSTPPYGATTTIARIYPNWSVPLSRLVRGTHPWVLCRAFWPANRTEGELETHMGRWAVAVASAGRARGRVPIGP